MNACSESTKKIDNNELKPVLTKVFDGEFDCRTLASRYCADERKKKLVQGFCACKCDDDANDKIDDDANDKIDDDANDSEIAAFVAVAVLVLVIVVVFRRQIIYLFRFAWNFFTESIFRSAIIVVAVAVFVYATKVFAKASTIVAVGIAFVAAMLSAFAWTSTLGRQRSTVATQTSVVVPSLRRDEVQWVDFTQGVVIPREHVDSIPREDVYQFFDDSNKTFDPDERSWSEDVVPALGNVADELAKSYLDELRNERSYEDVVPALGNVAGEESDLDELRMASSDLYLKYLN
jgi:uncharacterized membrane protein YvlD (DUF360 family)